MKKHMKILCLLLACVLFVVPLWSCDDSGDGNTDGGGLNDDGSVNWAEVDFKGAKLKFGIANDSKSGGTFKPAKDYLKGPDKETTDEVLKKVVARNNKVENDLKLTVEYLPIELNNGGYAAVQADIKQRVLGASTDAPDIYNNDMRAFTFALLEGHLMNVATPTDQAGNEMTSYFDFENDCWNYEFMREMSFDTRKVYVLAGDFHIDMIRMAQVIFVNKTLFNQNASALGFEDVNSFYDYVKAGMWDYDMLTDLCEKVWQDNGTVKEKADLADGRIGFVSGERLYFNFVPSTGLATFYMTEEGTPKLIEDIDEMNRMANKLREIWSNSGTGDGIYYQGGLDCITTFMQGNVLFAPATLGELESDELRNVSFDKGLVTIPKYDWRRQDAYHTMVEMYAELSAILVNAPSFTRASAYLQYINEQSADVLTEYYEFSLKFKYNDDPSIRSMIDLVYDTIDSPFGIWFESVILQYVQENTGASNLHHAISLNSLSSFYESNKDAYRVALQKALSDFAKIP